MRNRASLFFLFLTVAGALSAETPRWTRATPFGSEMVALTQAASSPRTLYAATAEAQVYASTDGGATWHLRPPALLRGETVLDVVADPLDAQIVYARTSSGLLRSLDGGARWSRVGTGLPAGKTVVPDLGLPGVLWAATSVGLYRSADRGETWQQMNAANVAAFAIDPFDPDTFVAGVRGDPLYSPLTILRSTDRGATWQTTAPLLLLPGDALGDPSFAFDSAHAGVLYVILPNSGLEPLFRTANLGDSWTALPGASINSLATSPDGVLYAATDRGVARSDDQGTTWTPPLFTPAAPRDRIVRVVASPALPRPLLAAGSAGLWASTDGGATWRDSSRGIVAPGTLSVLASPVGVPALTTVAAGSVYRSVDQGTTWARLAIGTPNARPVRLDALHPNRPRTLYGIGFDQLTDLVFKSTDGGRTGILTPVVHNCPGNVPCAQTIDFVALEPRRPDTVYAVGFFHPPAVGRFLVRSDDGFQGPTTLLEGAPSLTGLTADPDRPGILYGLTCQGLFQSFDAGVSWRKTGRNLPANVCATVLAFTPRDTRKLWIGTVGKGLFFSADGGKTLQSMSRGLETATIGALQLDPEDPARVYAGVAGRGVFRWNAGRRRWEPLPNPGLPTAGYLGALTLDPQDPMVLYAAHPKRGIFRLDLQE